MCADDSYNFLISINGTTIIRTISEVFSKNVSFINDKLDNLPVDKIFMQLCTHTQTNVTKYLINCEGLNETFCWMLIGLGGAITALLFIIVILCLVIVCLVAKRKRYQYSPGVTPSQRETVENHTQQQQQRPQNQGNIKLDSNFKKVQQS